MPEVIGVALCLAVPVISIIAIRWQTNRDRVNDLTGGARVDSRPTSDERWPS